MLFIYSSASFRHKKITISIFVLYQFYILFFSALFLYYENLNYYEKYFVYTNIVITFILFFIGIWAKREFTSKVNLKAVIVGFSILFLVK